MSDMDTEALRTIADAVVAIRGMLERQTYPAITVGAESALLDDSPPCAESGPHCGHWRDGKDICCACGAVVATDPTPTVPHGLASPAVPTVALSIRQPVDLSSLGLGAVVRARCGDRVALWLHNTDTVTPWVAADGDAWWCADSDLSDAEVLHPGIAIDEDGDPA